MTLLRRNVGWRGALRRGCEGPRSKFRSVAFVQRQTLWFGCPATTTSDHAQPGAFRSTVLAGRLPEILDLAQNGHSVGGQVFFRNPDEPDNASFGWHAERVDHKVLN